jgi:hypothetical protein
MVESIKLLDVLEANIDEIAATWAADVKKNKRTAHYRDIPDERLVVQAVKFYSQLRNMLIAPNRYERRRNFSCTTRGPVLKAAYRCMNPSMRST